MNLAITGVGALSALGIGEAFFQALESGRSGIGEVTTFDPGDGASLLAAEIPEFVLEEHLGSVKTYLDRASAFALAAGALALRDAGFAAKEERWRAGISVGTAFGCLDTMGALWGRIQEKGARLASSLLFSHSYANTPVSLAAIEFNLAGPHGCFCAGAASGGHALADAATQIGCGRAQAMLAGGVEALSAYLYTAATRAGKLSPGAGGREGIQPFAATRNGTVLGEGAALLLLERADAARRRGARIRARVLGCGLSGGPREEGHAAAMRSALADAEMQSEEVDAVFASAAGAREEDAWEAHALESLFGRRPTPVVALKASAGETLGAAGALAAAAAVHTLECGILPGAPDAPAPEFPLDLVRTPRRASPRRVLVNTFDERGGCVSLVLAAPDA